MHNLNLIACMYSFDWAIHVNKFKYLRTFRCLYVSIIVIQHKQTSTSISHGNNNWTTIGRIMGRLNQSCQFKYMRMTFEKKITGRFSREVSVSIVGKDEFSSIEKLLIIVKSQTYFLNAFNACNVDSSISYLTC